MMITIQLPDGTFAQKPIDALQPDDMIVFGDTRTTQHVTYRPQPMDWDFDATPEPVACQCRQCLHDRDEHIMIGSFKVPAEMTRMVLCKYCGNKRCPHANNHVHACTGSNDPGQHGSAYPAV